MPRILVIDDEPIYHKMIEHALRPLGYDVDFASSGAQGLNAAAALEPDVVITDVLMPGMNGYEVVRRLRRNPRFIYIPVLRKKFTKFNYFFCGFINFRQTKLSSN